MPIRSATCADVKPASFLHVAKVSEVAPRLLLPRMPRCTHDRSLLRYEPGVLYFILHFLQSAKCLIYFCRGRFWRFFDKDPK